MTIKNNMEEKDYLIRNIEEHIKIIESLRAQESNVIKAVNKICNCFHNGGSLLVMGNGGSFADALHIEGELVGKYKLDRKALPVKTVGTGGAFLTAYSNDFCYEKAYAREVEAYMLENDVLWGITTSGNSKNIINAFEKGRELKIYNILMTGKTGGKIKERNLADLIISIDSEDTPRIQEAHQLIYHSMCEAIEKNMFN